MESKARNRQEAEQVLGFRAALISYSKSWYCDQHPDHDVFFNAQVFDADKQRIWSGDLDLTLSRDKLQELANRIGLIVVTPEHPFVFDGLPKQLNLASFDETKVEKYSPESELRVFRPRQSIRASLLRRSASEEEVART